MKIKRTSRFIDGDTSKDKINLRDCLAMISAFLQLGVRLEISVIENGKKAEVITLEKA